jgi:hypothetical protein
MVNGGEEVLGNLVLELSSDPPFLEAKSWRIDALRENSTLHITDPDVNLHAGYWSDLTESVTGEVRLRLLKDDSIMAEISEPVKNPGAEPSLGPVPNGTGLSGFLVAAAVADLLEAVPRSDQQLIGFRPSFHCPGLVPEGSDAIRVSPWI